MDVMSLCLACHLISLIDNLLQFLGQFVDLKFCSSIFTKIKYSSLLSKKLIISIINFKAISFYQNIFEKCLKKEVMSSSVKTVPGHF